MCMLKHIHLFRVLVLDMLVVVISGVVDIMLIHVASRQSPLMFTDPTPPQLRALSCLYWIVLPCDIGVSELCATCWMVDCKASVRIFRDSNGLRRLLLQAPDACTMPERRCAEVSALQCSLSALCCLDLLTTLSHKLQLPSKVCLHTFAFLWP